MSMSAIRGVLRPAVFRAAGQMRGGVRPATFQPVLMVRYFSAEVPKDSAFTNATSSLTDVATSAMDSTIISDPNTVDLATAAAVASVGGLENVNFVVRYVMEAVDAIHTVAGIPYWEAIVATTVGLRVLLLPVVLKTTQGSARMAAMRPEMQKVQDRMAKDPNVDDMRVKLKYQTEMKALFGKYQVNPLRAIMWPLFQFPIFIAFFMALREMGIYYPGMVTGGDFWFTDLTAADAYFALPVLNSLSFLAMIELGSDGLNVKQQGQFKWAMRGLSVVMVPLTASMPQGLFVYWVTNNFLSLGQTFALKNKSLRAAFDIPDIPVENAPVLKMVNPVSSIAEMIRKERSQGENAKAEILEGVKSAPKVDDAKPAVFYDRPPPKKQK